MASVETSGLSIDTLDQVLADLDADFLDEFGTGPDGIDTSALSYTGRQNPIIARRVVETQQLLAELVSVLNPNNAQGRILDFIGTLFDEPRAAATRATIQTRCYGIPGFTIGDRRVRYVRNSTIWRVPIGTVIGADGTVDVALSSDVAGTTLDDGTTIEAFQDGSDQWVIVDSSVSFHAVESTGDFAEGTDTEGPASYRARIKLAGRGSGTSTEPGIRRAITRVAGTSVLIDNNRELTANANGVPGKAIEVVFDQGTADDVAQAIYDSFSDTAEWYGSSVGYATKSDGTPVAVRLTPAERIEVAWSVAINTAGAEVAMPDDPESLIEAALTEYTNTVLTIGLNVVPEEGEAVVRTALPKGSIPAGQLTVTVGLKGGALGPATIVLTSRQRARTDAEAQAAERLATNTGPYNIVAGQILQLSADGGSAQSITFNVADFAVISAATVLEVATAINNRLNGFVAGTEGGALVIRSSTTGAASSVAVGAGSTAGLLTTLGLTVATVSGSEGDIAVTIT